MARTLSGIWARSCLLLAVSGLLAASCGGDKLEPADSRILEGLANVENTLFAIGSVWAVTSDLQDNYSPGEVNASLVRIDPETDETSVVLDGLEKQPTLASLGDRVWAKLQGRIVAFDANGSEVASLDWPDDGEMFAGERYVWVTDFLDGQVSAIDPASAEIVRSVGAGEFPVGPLAAFGHIWLPSATGGTVTILDEATLGVETNLTVASTPGRQTHATAVPGGATGDEVWVANIDGELFALGAEESSLGDVRQVEVDRAINSLVPHRQRAVLLPTWGQAVLVIDLASGEVLAEIPIDSIPYRAVSAGDYVWVTGDGTMETLSRIDPQSLSLTDQLEVGANQSNTTGPTQPFIVGDEVWVPNRGDDAIFVVRRG